MTKRSRPEAEVYREAQAVADGILAKLNPPRQPGQFSFDQYIDDIVAGVSERPGIVREDHGAKLDREESEAMHDAWRHMMQMAKACKEMAQMEALCGFDEGHDAWIRAAEDLDALPTAVQLILSQRRVTDPHAIVSDIGHDCICEAIERVGICLGLASGDAIRRSGISISAGRLLDHAHGAASALTALLSRHARTARYRAWRDCTPYRE